MQTLFYVNPTQLDPFLDPEGQPDPFEPKNWAQNWVELPPACPSHRVVPTCFEIIRRTCSCALFSHSNFRVPQMFLFP